MTKDIKPRKATLEECIRTAEYCIANSNDYSATAKTYNCSYGQVYPWVKKYGADGVDGLKDKCGRTRPEEELSEMEKLKAENRLLRAEKKKQQMEIGLLKKPGEIERGGATLGRTRHLNACLDIKGLSEGHDGYLVSEMCRILGIGRAACYKWKNHGNSRNDNLNELIAEKAEKNHAEHPDMGCRRIRDTLAHEHGISINGKRMLRICRKKKTVRYKAQI